MSVLSPPRHPYVDRALRLATRWCAGQIIDDAPALRHAALVARTLGDLAPHVAPELVAAALLHDAPLFAPRSIRLDLLLNLAIAPGVASIVQGIATEHATMDRGELPPLNDQGVILVSAADKVVAFRSLIHRAHKSGDQHTFWTTRTTLCNLLPYFHEWIRQASPHLPRTLAGEVRTALDQLHTAIASHRCASRPAR